MFLLIEKAITKLYLILEKYYYIFLALAMLVLGIGLFYKLGIANIKDWDEARHGVNAYEMLRNHNYVVNTYMGSNDYWNLKPPVSYWFIIFGYKIFGYNPLGLRFFSALAILLTSTIIVFFAKYRHGRIASLITMLAFMTFQPIITDHWGRTGDADAIYILFFTISIISMLLIEKNIKFLYISGLAFSIAFLTKSFHAIVIAVIIGLYLILSKRLFKLKLKEFFIFLMASFLPILIWGVFRYFNDGFTFFKQMIDYDLLNRSSNAIEGHVGDKWFYVNVFTSNYLYWTFLLFSGLVAYLVLNDNEKIKERFKYIIGVILWIVVPFALFSKAKTKLGWYVYCIVPPLAICIGAFTGKLAKEKKKNVFLQGLLIFMVIFSSALYESKIVHYIKTQNEDSLQVTLRELGHKNEYKGANIYIGDKGSDWSQSEYLSALLYSDLYAKKTGIDGFENDSTKNSLMLIRKTDESNKIIDSNNFKIVIDENGYCIVKK
ncbi:glycosyltransferase family 39 protein [Clostridium sp. 19966]|uniref:ArnT family glycosyltransferase n=1 Tax=Clostridium sp. 19966 TaxID=2768166 RepID=UPI0028DE2708|nr:glycosyltransferase family 39 protein [Clostridium sp. 19966]MDT8716166.1 glycosyltransferase family 39 protein [Clostridium sp. 19966]